MQKISVSRSNPRKRRRSALTSPRLPEAKLSPEIKQDCKKSSTVRLTNLISDMHNTVKKLEKEMKTLTEFQALTEPLLEHIVALSYIINPPTHPSVTMASNSTKLIDTIATEVSLRIRAARNVVVFNVPDRVPIDKVRTALLQYSGLTATGCTCLRLRKRTLKHTCPLLFRFDSESQAQIFMSSQQLLRQQTPFKNIVLAKDRTRIERITATTTLVAAAKPHSPCHGPSVLSTSSLGNHTPPAKGKKPEVSPCLLPSSSVPQNNKTTVDLDRTLSPTPSPFNLKVFTPKKCSVAETAGSPSKTPTLRPLGVTVNHASLSATKKKPVTPSKPCQNTTSPSIPKFLGGSLLGTPPIKPRYRYHNSLISSPRSSSTTANDNLHQAEYHRRSSPPPCWVPPHQSSSLDLQDASPFSRLQRRDISSASLAANFLSMITALTKPPPVQPHQLIQLLGLAQILHAGQPQC